MLNDLVSRIDALSDVSEIGVIVVRLDFLNRMLVSLDVDQDIIDTIGTLHSTAAAMESSANASGGYYPPCSASGQRGRPSFEISRDHLAFLLEHGFKVQEISCILGVGKRTVERRMAVFGLSITGKKNTAAGDGSAYMNNQIIVFFTLCKYCYVHAGDEFAGQNCDDCFAKSMVSIRFRDGPFYYDIFLAEGGGGWGNFRNKIPTCTAKVVKDNSLAQRTKRKKKFGTIPEKN